MCCVYEWVSKFVKIVEMVESKICRCMPCPTENRNETRMLKPIGNLGKLSIYIVFSYSYSPFRFIFLATRVGKCALLRLQTTKPLSHPPTQSRETKGCRYSVFIEYTLCYSFLCWEPTLFSRFIKECWEEENKCGVWGPLLGKMVVSSR